MPPKAKRRRKEGDHVGVGHQAALESVARSDAVDKDKPDAKRLQTSKERAQVWMMRTVVPEGKTFGQMAPLHNVHVAMQRCKCAASWSRDAPVLASFRTLGWPQPSFF
eukprot:evm.model.scf_2411.2 EVM.evm.TU.scf_2411.2   scf_2411:9591-10030(+)